MLESVASITVVSEYALPLSGAALQARRIELGLTQRQIADACGITAAAVGAWETRGGQPRAQHIPALLKILKIDVDTPERVQERLVSEVSDLRRQVGEHEQELSQLRADVAALGQRLRMALAEPNGPEIEASPVEPAPGQLQP